MELAIIVIYLAAIFGVGIYCNKFNNNIDDYLLAGRRRGPGDSPPGGGGRLPRSP